MSGAKVANSFDPSKFCNSPLLTFANPKDNSDKSENRDNTQLFSVNGVILSGRGKLVFLSLHGSKMCIVGDLLSLCTKRKAESDGTSIVIQA